MLATMRPDGDDARQARDDAETLPIVLPLPVERHPYAPPPEHKIFGFLGTCLVFAVAFAGLLLTFEHHFNPPPPSAPLVVSLLPLASPPETPPKPKEAPKPVEKHQRQPTPQKVVPVERPIIPVPTIAPPPPAPAVKPVDPTPPQPETAAPKTAPAPPAPQVSSNAPDTWEGRVLARLQKYPALSRRGEERPPARRRLYPVPDEPRRPCAILVAGAEFRLPGARSGRARHAAPR